MNSSKKAKIYEIELPQYIITKYKDNETLVLRYINNLTKDNKMYKRGDIIHPKKLSGYRNSFKYIYNGVKFEKLGTLNCEYGEIPKSFLTFTEFPPFYWEDVIYDSENHYINPSLLKMKKSQIIYEGLKLYIYTIKYNSKDYRIASVKNIDNRKIVLIRQSFENRYFDFIVKSKKMSEAELNILDF